MAEDDTLKTSQGWIGQHLARLEKLRVEVDEAFGKAAERQCESLALLENVEEFFLRMRAKVLTCLKEIYLAMVLVDYCTYSMDGILFKLLVISLVCESAPSTNLRVTNFKRFLSSWLIQGPCCKFTVKPR